MTPLEIARLRDIRARVRRFRAMTIDQKMAEPGFAFGCIADAAFLVGLYDACLRERAHLAGTPAGPLPVVGASTTPATAMSAVPGPDSFDAGWNAALGAAAVHVQTVLVAAVRDGANPYQTRARVAEAIGALEHKPPTLGHVAPAPLPAREPPPFTA
jgi:hypothetical protein